MRRYLTDAALWVALAAPVVAGQVLPPREDGWALRLVLEVLALALAVWLARQPARFGGPLAGLVVVIAGCMVDGNFSFSIPVLSYLVGRRETRAWPAAVVFGGIGLFGSALSIGLFDTGIATWFFLVTTLLFAGVFPWLVGRYRRQHHELVTVGWQRAEHLERERGMVAAQVRLRERARIARDMHDSLGHDLSLLALRAGALELAAGPESAAAAEIRAGAVAATARLREIVGVLREDDTPAPLAPRDESIAALVERARASGLSVTLTADPVPGHVERTAYGIVQEALTNAARHAPGAPVTVEITSGTGSTTVTVTNPVPPGTVVVEGFGLAGLRERVRMAGGTVHIGSGDGAHRVQSHVPHDSQPPRPPAPPLRTARRRVRRSLVTALAAPAAIAVVMSLTYYPVAAFDSVLEQDAFDRMPIGATRDDLALPGRQVLNPPNLADPSGLTCEYYSDGNFPLANATFRLCFRDGKLERKERL
jgi:signal transduction histidine kinase